jgi:hypothetical protein
MPDTMIGGGYGGGYGHDASRPKLGFERRLASLKQERQSWMQHWQDLAQYVLPRAGRFLSTTNNRGEKVNDKIYNSIPTYALRTLVSGMTAGITSPARPWFRLASPDPELMEVAGVRWWLHDTERRMRVVFNRSNVYNSLSSIYEELGLFGTAAMVVEPDAADIIRCYPLTAGEYMLANSGRLTVDTLYRELRLTTGQLVERFGYENCSTTVQNHCKRGEIDIWIDVIHAVEPRKDRDYTKVDRKNKPWRSVYFEAGGDQDRLLSDSGYDDFPAMAPRWYVSGTDTYGRSPGMDVLGDVKALMVLERRMAQGVDKVVNPAMVGPASLKNAVVNLLPGGVTYIDGQTRDVFRPAYEVNLRLGELDTLIQRHEQRIQRGFYADLFLMMSEQDDVRTATEVRVRQEEKLLVLGPMLERLQAELLDPLIDRTFKLMLEAGAIMEPPPEIQGADLKVEYISLLAQSQQAIATGAIERMAGFVGNLAGANPEVLDKMDFDQAVDEYGEALGVPPKIVRSDDAVAELRQGRAQQQQALQQGQAAMTAAQGAQVLSQTDTRSDNALTRMLGINP